MKSVVWQKLSSIATERWLRIDTTGRVEPVNGEGVHYTPLPYIMIFKMLDFLQPSHEEVFVDIGSGKGRVICCAARLRLKKVIGVELNERLVRIARTNLSNVRGRKSEVEIVHGSAEDFCFDSATLIYLYNPFSERLTNHVMASVRSSFSRSQRPMRFVYANPVHESAFSQDSWLEKYAEWSPSDFPGFGYPVSFWRTRS